MNNTVLFVLQIFLQAFIGCLGGMLGGIVVVCLRGRDGDTAGVERDSNND